MAEKWRQKMMFSFLFTFVSLSRYPFPSLPSTSNLRLVSIAPFTRQPFLGRQECWTKLLAEWSATFGMFLAGKFHSEFPDAPRSQAHPSRWPSFQNGNWTWGNLPHDVISPIPNFFNTPIPWSQAHMWFHPPDPPGIHPGVFHRGMGFSWSQWLHH